MTFQPGATVYTQSFGSRPENVEVPHIDVRAPAPTDILYPVGKRWIDTIGNASYELTSFTTSGNVTTAVWTLLATSGGALNTLSDQSATTVTPSAGNIQLNGTAGQIATTAGSSEITFSLVGPYTPTTYTAHGVLIGEGGSSIVATTPGSNGQVLIGSTAADPAFATITSSGSTLTLTGGAHTLNIDVTAPLNVAHGGTGAITLTAHGVLLGEGTGAIVATAVGATNSVLQGSTGANPSFTTTPSVVSLTATTGDITATAGNLVATAGNLNLNGAASKINIDAATAASASIGTATLTSGTVVVSTTAVTASSLIFLSYNNLTSALACSLDYGTIVAGVSFAITSQDLTDSTSTVNYWIIN